MTCDEFQTIVMFYVELSWIVMEFVGFDYIVYGIWGSPSGQLDKIGSNKKWTKFVG
jgi:hypothetical protein